MCHQTVSLTARHLEEAGIPTIVVGSARDIVEECGVPRFLFVDFPLGNPCGKPDDSAMQSSVIAMALDLVEHAWQSRTTVGAPFVWNPDDEWRSLYARVDDSNRAELAFYGERRRAKQAAVKTP